MIVVIELDKNRLTGCSLSRTFPYLITNTFGEVLQYAKTQDGAEKWVRENGHQLAKIK